MKWLLALLFFTSFFIVSSFFIDTNNAFAYRWMTIGMAIVSFIFYFSINKRNAKNAGGNLAAIVIKFMLSCLVFIIYIIAFKSRNRIDFYFFLIAYILFSIVSYVGAYYSIKEEQQRLI